MRSSTRFALAAGFVALSALASVLAAPALPARVVTHWNASGVPDGTMAKPFALAFVPALTAVLLAVFAAIPRIDPLRENVEAFRPQYDWFVVLFAGYMLAVHLGTLAFNLGYRFDFTRFVLAAVAVLFYYVGVVLDHAEPNWFVGIRTPWTLSDPEVWARTHALGSRLFKLSAVVALVGLLFGRYAVYFLLVPALATAVVTVAYSYYAYRHLDETTARAPGP